MNVVFDDLANLQSKTDEELGSDLIKNTFPSIDIEINDQTPTSTSPRNEDFQSGHLSNPRID